MTVSVWQFEFKYSFLSQLIFLIVVLQSPGLKKQTKQSTKATMPRISFFTCQLQQGWEATICEHLHCSQAHAGISSNHTTPRRDIPLTGFPDHAVPTQRGWEAGGGSRDRKWWHSWEWTSQYPSSFLLEWRLAFEFPRASIFINKPQHF